MQKITTQWIAQNASKIHYANVDKGFYDIYPPRELRLKTLTFLRRIANLITEETMEPYSAIRKGFIKATPEQIEATQKHSGMDYFNAYEETIKGTAEEEVADIVIRAIDFLGAVSEDFSILEKSILGNISAPADYDFDLGVQQLRHCTAFIDSKHTGLHSFRLNPNAAQRKLQEGIFTLIDNVQLMADFYSIDLLQAIEMKLQYNLSRPHKHGKNF